MGIRYDVIVVGAGPAGCSAAAFAANKGYSVLLLDKAKFPRDKVCGDGISPQALPVLERMGVLGEIEGKNPWRIEGVTISSPSGQIVTAEFSYKKGMRNYGFIFPRKDFDWLLFDFVSHLPGVDVFENCEVTDLVYEGNTFFKITVKGEDCPQGFIGKVVVAADGARSTIAKKGFRTSHHRKHGAFAVRGYFDNVKGLGHYVEIHFEKSLLPAYGWIFPVGEHSANVGLGASTRFLKGKKITRLFHEFITQNRYMTEKFKSSIMRKNSLKGWPIPSDSLLAKRSRRNVLLIGDAGNFADAMTGEGIYYALRSGEYAAQAIGSAMKKSIDFEEKVGEVYERLWRKEFKWREYFFGRNLQRVILTNPFLNFNINRAIKNQKMAETLADILCHNRSKIRLLF